MAANLVDTFSTTPIDLAGNDTLDVTAPGSIVTSDVAIVWNLDDPSVAPPGVVVVNNGYIASTDDRAIETDGSLNGAQAISLTNHGTITATGDAFKIGDDLTDGIVVINNYGTFESTDDGQVFDFNDVEEAASIVITNFAGGLIRATGADAMRPGVGAEIHNHGHIVSEDGDGIDFQDDDGGVVTNHDGGLIEGSKHGITGDEAVTVHNAAGGTIIGHNGSAVNIDNEGGEENTVHVVNHGVMEGRSAETDDSDGDAIDTDGLLILDNYGSIKGLGHEGYHDGEPNLSEGIATGGGVINNFAGGEIYGYGRAIQVDDSSNGAAFSATMIHNEGLIEGGGNGPEGVLPEDAVPLLPTGNEAINLVGDWADELFNSGVIIGGVMMDGGADTLTNMGAMSAMAGSAVDMGAGNDIVNAYVGSSIDGLLDGGADTDTLNLLGEGAGEVGAVVNFEALAVQAGVWRVMASQAYADGIVIAAGASLIVGDGVSLGGDIAVAGRLVIENPGLATLGQVITGTGVVEFAGGGTTTLAAASSYSGGTLLAAGTLAIGAAGAAGTGDIAFGDGGQTLVVDNGTAALVASEAAATFANAIVDFGTGDAIELTGLAFAAGASVDYDAATGMMTVSGYGASYRLTVVDPEATDFTAENDGAGGTRIVLEDVGVTIVGNSKGNTVDASQSVFGQPLPTASDDLIKGRGGHDRLSGLAGNDDIQGGRGKDRIKGGDGNDLVNGGLGKNKVTGNEGADAFVFDTRLGDGKHADKGTNFTFTRITDFDTDEDLVLLDQAIFTGLSLGPLSASEFGRGKKAKDSDDHILYHKKSGGIWYDADGEGGEDAVMFARVSKGTSLDAGDFLVV